MLSTILPLSETVKRAREEILDDSRKLYRRVVQNLSGVAEVWMIRTIMRDVVNRQLHHKRRLRRA